MSSPAPSLPPTNQLPSPAIAFDPTVGFMGPNAATLTGTASDPSGIAGVEIFQGSTDLGAATVDQGAGTWSFRLEDSPGAKTGLTAVATAGDGVTASAPSHYDLTTGIRGLPYTARQDSYDAEGDLVGQTFFRQRGAIYLQTATTTNPDGSYSVLTTGGGYFAKLPYFAIEDDFSAAGRPTEEDVYCKDGHQTVQGLVGHRSLDSIADDTFLPTGKGNSFVFTRGFGQDTITAFNLAGPGHDTISLPEGASARLGAILAGATTDAAGNAVLQINPHDAITVEGVSAADLLRNRRDFTVHA